MTTTFPHTATSRIFTFHDPDPEVIRRELATIAPGKVINGWRVTYVQHIGEIMPHKDGYAVIACVEGMEVSA